MPDETLIRRIEELLVEVTLLGGQNERTSIVSNLTVVDAAPTGLTNFITITDERDGDTILAKTVPGVIYAVSDKVNVLFVEGTEPIAFQHGSESPSGGLWEIVPSTSTDIFYDRGDVGIGKSVAPDASLEVLDTTQAQLRLTHTEDTEFVDFTLDTNHDLTITPSSTGQVIFQPTTDSLDFFQVLDADGGTPVLNVDSTNERVGMGTATPATTLDVSGSITVADDIIHSGDINTFLQFGIDTFAIFAGGFELAQFDAASAQKEIILNADPDDVDFRVRGDADAHLIFTESSTDRVGIGTSGPDTKLDVLATTTQLRLTHTDGSKFVDLTLDTNHDLTVTPSSTGQIIFQPTTDSLDFFQVLDVDGGVPVFNVDSINERVGIGTAAPEGFLHIKRGGVVNFIFESTTTRAHLVMRHTAVTKGAINSASTGVQFGYGAAFASNIAIHVLSTNGDIGMGGVTSPSAEVHIDQASTTAAQPVLKLDQADVSEEFIAFIGTAAAATLTQSLVDEGDVTTATRIGWFKIDVDDVGNQITDGAYFVPFYSLA